MIKAPPAPAPSEIVTSDGVYSAVAVLQEPPVAPEGVSQILRPHRIRIGLYNTVGNSIVRTDSVEIDVDGARTEVPELVGKPVAELLLVNDEDLTFAKIRLDEHSSKTTVAGLGKITDGVARSLIWGASWDMTRDGELKTSEYLALIANTDFLEMEIGVVQQILLQGRSAIEQFGAPTKRADYRDKLFATIKSQLPNAEPGGDHQLAFVRNLNAIARTDEHTALITEWLEGKNLPVGLEVDTDLRWSLLSRLVALGKLNESAIDAELARDNTATGQRQAAVARAAIPTIEAKERAWAAALSSDTLTNALLSATVGGFAQPDQRELLAAFVDRYFAVLPEIWSTRTNETAQTITGGFYPSLMASQEILDKSDAFLASDDDAGSTRLIRELRDSVARSLRCQAIDGA